jgi:hypothetical protein
VGGRIECLVIADPLSLIGTAAMAILGCLIVYRARQISQTFVHRQTMWKWRTEAFYLWTYRILGTSLAIYGTYEFIKLEWPDLIS